MPKETIQFAMFDDQFDDVEMSVNWSKESEGGWVQIGMTRHVSGPEDPDARVKSIHADHSACSECYTWNGNIVQDGKVHFAPQWPENVTLPFKERKATPEDNMPGYDTILEPLPPHGSVDPAGVATVWSAPMRRDQINKMIKTLRRARDQAYGPDE